MTSTLNSGTLLTMRDPMSHQGHEELFEQRRKARAQAAARLERLRSRHFDEVLPAFASRLSDARAMIDLWERRQLCSRTYIDRWRALLDAGSDAVAIRDEDALLQNSPFFCPSDDGPRH